MKARYFLLTLVAIVVVIGIGLALISGNVDRFRPKIQAELQQKLNRPVTIGHLSLRLLPLSIRVEGFTIGDDPIFASSQPFATASQVFVSAGLVSLLTGNPEVKDVVLDQPQIELIRNAQGKWNFSTLGSSSSSGSSTKFSLDKLQITDGKVALTDVLHHQPRSQYDHIDLNLTDFAQDKKFGLALAVHLPGQGKQLAEFKGKVGPLSQGAASAPPPVTGHLSLDEVSLAAVNRFAAGTLPDKTDSVASGGADVDTTGGRIEAKGNLKLANTTIRGAKLDYPIEAKYEVGADQAFDNIAIKSANVTLGVTKFEASGSINNAAKPAVVDVQLKTSDSSITELAKLAGAVGVAFSPDYKIDGRLTVNLAAKGPLNAPQLSGNIVAKNVSASGGEIKEPVSTPEIDLTLTPQSVLSNTFVARSGSTALNVAFSLANYATKDPLADVTLRTSNAQIAEILNIAKAYGVTAAKGVTGTGTLSLDVHAHGETSHPNALTYAGTANIQNAILTTPELTKPVGIRTVSAQFSQNSVALSNLAASVGSTNLSGSLSARNFTEPNVQFALAADRIDTDELGKLVAPTPAQPAASSSPRSPRPSSQPSLLKTMTGGGTLSVASLKAQEILLTRVTAKMTMDRGLLTLSPLSAGAFGGAINGTLVDDMRPATSQCSLNAKLQGVDANALLSAVSTMKNQLSGSLAATTNLRFALASSNDLARTLNGTVEFALANGQLKNVNILNELAKVGKFLNSSSLGSSGSATALKQFSGALNIADGVATTNNLKAVLDAGSLAANGSLNLANQGINMHMTAVLAGGASKSVGGTGVGGILNTVMANNKGELVVPVLVTGSTSHMIFTPDVQAMAKMKLGNLLPTSADPSKGTAGGLGGVLGGLLGGQKPPPAAGKSPDAKQQQQPDNTLDSILGQFKKKKK